MMVTLDHVTVRTGDLNAAREFFINLFELKEQRRPRAIQHIPGHWLCSNGTPVAHLIGSFGTHYAMPAEAIDHVGFLLAANYHDTFVKKVRDNEHYVFTINY